MYFSFCSPGLSPLVMIIIHLHSSVSSVCSSAYHVQLCVSSQSIFSFDFIAFFTQR